MGCVLGCVLGYLQSEGGGLRTLTQQSSGNVWEKILVLSRWFYLIFRGVSRGTGKGSPAGGDE